MINLYYSKKEDKLISEIAFVTMSDLLYFLAAKFYYKSVYLIGIEAKNLDEIFVSDLSDNCYKFIETFVSENEFNVKIFFFENSSFENAYLSALNMKESNPLCYEQE